MFEVVNARGRVSINPEIRTQENPLVYHTKLKIVKWSGPFKLQADRNMEEGKINGPMSGSI